MKRAGERGVVGVNLALVIAFALYAVIQLSRVVPAGGQIDDRVKTIVAEVGPGSRRISAGRTSWARWCRLTATR